MAGYITVPDGEMMYRTAISMLKGEHFLISGILYKEKGVNQKIYSIYALGFSLVMIPLILIGYILANFAPQVPTETLVAFFASSTNSIITALTCLGVYLFAKELSFSKKNAFILALLYGFGTTAWHYSKSSFSEPTQSMSLLFTLYYAFKYRRDLNKLYFILSAIFLGLFILAKTFNIFFLPVILLYVLYDKKAQKIDFILRKSFLFLLTLSPFIIFLLVTNKIRFNAFFVTGYEDVGKGFINISPYIFIRLFQLLFFIQYRFFYI